MKYCLLRPGQAPRRRVYCLAGPGAAQPAAPPCSRSRHPPPVHRGFFQRQHDIQHVEGQVAAGAMRPPRLNRVSHIGHARATSYGGGMRLRRYRPNRPTPPLTARTTPSKLLGSGTLSEPSSPWISIQGRWCPQISKLVTTLAMAPLANSSVPAICVLTSTGSRCAHQRLAGGDAFGEGPARRCRPPALPAPSD